MVVDDRHLKEKLCDAAFWGIYSINSFCNIAPVIVIVVREKSKFLDRIGGLLRGTKFYLVDIGIACEHFVLQAEEFGLGTCWIGWFNERAVKQTLNIPRNKKIDILMALGYYDINKVDSKHNRTPMDRMASFNTY